MNLQYFGQWHDFKHNHKMRLEFYTNEAVTTTQQMIVRSCIEERPSLSPYDGSTLFGTVLTITVASPSSLEYAQDFYLGDMKGKLVKLFMDWGQSGQKLVFVGYVNSEVYEDDFSGRLNYDVIITCNNGIGILDRMLFLQENGDPYIDFVKNIDIIQRCLSALEITYDKIYIASNLYLGLMGAQDSIFHVVYSKAVNFYDESDEPMTMKEVLSDLLFSNLCRLFIYDNCVYIIDVGFLTRETISAKRYNFSTFAYEQDEVIQLGPVVLDELKAEYSIYTIPAKNKIDLSFNKYIYEEDEMIGVTPENLSYGGGVVAYYDEDDKFKYNEQAFLHCPNVEWILPITLPFSSFVVRSDASDSPTESFVRIPTRQYGDEWIVRFKSRRLLQSSDLFVGISGQIQFENPYAIGVQSNIPLWHDMYPTLPVYIRPLILGANGFPNWSFQMDGEVKGDHLYQEGGATIRRTMGDEGWLYTERSWVPGIHDVPLGTIFGFASADGPPLQYNTWYPLNGALWHSMGRVVRSFVYPYNVFDALIKNAIIIPLRNMYSNTANSPQGGYFAFDFFYPPLDKFPMIRNILLKDISITILKETADGQFTPVRDSDMSYRSEGDSFHKSTLSLETKQGTDSLGLARGTYSCKVTGIAPDSPYATNERFVNLEKAAYLFPGPSEDIPTFNTQNGATGTIEISIRIAENIILLAGHITSYNGVSLDGKLPYVIVDDNGDIVALPPTMPPISSYLYVIRAAAFDSSFLYIAHGGILYKISRSTNTIVNNIVTNGKIFSICLGDNGELWFGGSFTSYTPEGGSATTAGKIARVSASTFAPNSNIGSFSLREVSAIAYTPEVTGQGHWLVIGLRGGGYSEYTEPSSGDTFVVERLLTLSASTGLLLDPTKYHQGQNFLTTPANYAQAGVTGDVHSILVRPTGQGFSFEVIVAGDFSHFGFAGHSEVPLDTVAVHNILSFTPPSGALSKKGNTNTDVRIAWVHRSAWDSFIVGYQSPSETSLYYNGLHIMELDTDFNPIPTNYADYGTTTPARGVITFNEQVLIFGDFSKYRNVAVHNIVLINKENIPIGYSGTIGSPQKALISMYARQYETPRRLLMNATIWQYVKPFQNFQYALLQRDGENAMFVINRMEIDYVNSTVEMDLEELI